ncbi:activating transcription factor 3 [Malaya genurostris]|uniref:activating transcription factor 3 n=1 Tax=Malaya genurostris TaxID=325434 RepID=UPI0026F3CDDE|nr:activating transcription factor 3 [Malaya genurostris]XP_058455189.1 activating transcription factor 3 [Malaya genurostris]XP_058455190.1 activating transcription factor 3 [Malaya genurostris]XP_058455191.1 activating transcription factor 3 [Malaya genurostris]
MFNSNLSLTVPPLLGIDGGVCTTPRTPEILNSLMAMTNPLEYSYPVTAAVMNGSSTTCNNNPTSQASHDSHSNSSDSPLDSPAGPGRTPSVQQTRSQLIKAGVKLLIQSKRKHSGCESSDGNESSSGGGGGGGGGSERGKRSNGGSRQKLRHDTDLQTSEDDVENHRTTSGCSSTGGNGRTGSPRTGLTPEDEDRRRRRRERNKIAATKCRMKKRERTVNLVNESETLDAQNKELKSQVSELENQRRKLMEVLQAHSPTCVHQKGYQPLPSLSTITNNNCKFLNDLNFLDNAGEIKYSECLKSGSELGDYSKQDNTLPPGYCKLSPTEVNYGTPTDVMDVNSFPSQPLKSEYIPNGQQQRTRSKPGPKPRQRSGASVKRPISATSTTTTITENHPPVPVTLPSADFILKNELIDTSSPYTTIQSADRFLFDSSMDLYNNNNNDSNTLDSHHANENDKLTSLAVKDNASNALLEFSSNFDTVILKPSEYAMLTTNQPQENQQLQQQQQHHHHHQQQHQQQCHLQQNLGLLLPHQQTIHNPNQFLSHSSLGGAIVTNDFLILPEHDTGEFTDLDSGITSYTNINGSCLA